MYYKLYSNNPKYSFPGDARYTNITEETSQGNSAAHMDTDQEDTHTTTGAVINTIVQSACEWLRLIEEGRTDTKQMGCLFLMTFVTFRIWVKHVI